MADPRKIIALSAPVAIKAAEGEQAIPTFEVTAYSGGALRVSGWGSPVVIDLAGLQFSRNVIANLDHVATQRVGHVTDKSKADGKVTLSGTFSAATPYRDEVVNSAKQGWEWEASVEVNPHKVVEVDAGKTVSVNGQEFSGPLSVVRKGTMTAFAFVSHGADQHTEVSIAASAASNKEKAMKPEVKAWVKAMLPSVDLETLTAEEVANLEADYEGREGKRQTKTVTAANPFEERKVEAKRRKDIRDIADKFIDDRDGDLEFIEAVERMHDHAIASKMGAQEFRTEMWQSMLPAAHTVSQPVVRDKRITKDVIEAAICVAGRLEGHEKLFDDQTLQMAHDHFRNGIGLKQLFLIAAEANGYRANFASDVNIDVQRAAFNMTGPRQIKASGWSTIDIATILSNTANKFLRDGWNAVDQTPLRIAAIRPVRNFQQITTVSLTGALQFEQLGPAGEIKHGTLGEVVYTNKADTYAKMLAITRQDIINDDLGALTAVPRRLGRGAMLLLNHIFWTAFLNNGSFFTSGNSNVNTGVADMTVGGLAATETIFMDQTDPDGKPLGSMPAILLVPTALKAAAMTLMSSERLIDGSSTTVQGDANIWRGRFRVESSPYMSNSAYTGYSAAAWYMMADPADLPVIEIVALNGRVEPVVETADADFNVLGVQMRGYSDVGVALQEYRAGVRADGGSS